MLDKYKILIIDRCKFKYVTSVRYGKGSNRIKFKISINKVFYLFCSYTTD